MKVAGLGTAPRERGYPEEVIKMTRPILLSTTLIISVVLLPLGGRITYAQESAEATKRIDERIKVGDEHRDKDEWAKAAEEYKKVWLIEENNLVAQDRMHSMLWSLKKSLNEKGIGEITKSPDQATLFSFIPGMGQFYAEKPIEGQLFLAAGVILGIAGYYAGTLSQTTIGDVRGVYRIASIASWGGLGGIIAWSMIDAGPRAREYNEKYFGKMWQGPPGAEYEKGGRFYRKGKDDAEMVWVPGGIFTMGSSSGRRDAKPPHQVRIEGFWMDVTEATNAQFKKFVDATGYEPKYWVYDPTKADHPATNVTWFDAQAYAEWAGKRLPTEAEWEYAAGGPNYYTWSLGNGFDEKKYNFNAVDEYIQTSPAGSYPANKYGLYDMSGNVWEWSGDWYDEGYYANSPQDNPQGPPSGEGRALRGGSWNSESVNLRVSLRHSAKPDDGYLNLGFRCVLRDLPL